MTILGWFGCGNVGDDTILYNEILLLQEKFQTSNITVFCGDPKIIKQNFKGVETIALPPIMWYRFYKFFNIFYLFRVLKIIKNSDIFILGGGGFFSDRQYFSIGGWLRYCKIAKYFGAIVIGFGMGAGPFFYQNNKNLIKKSSVIFDFLIVRDNISFTYLLETGFEKGKLYQMVDLAFFTKFQNSQKSESIGFIIHSNEGYFTKQIKYILDNTHYNIKFIITDTLDIHLNEQIITSLGNQRCTIHMSSKIANIIKEISSCDFIISQRLHGSIIAFTQKVPFLNIYYHHKGKELIKLLGIDQFSFNIDQIEDNNILSYIQKKDDFTFLEPCHLAKYKITILTLLGKI